MNREMTGCHHGHSLLQALQYIGTQIIYTEHSNTFTAIPRYVDSTYGYTAITI